MTIAKIKKNASRLLKLFGPHGEHWAKGSSAYAKLRGGRKNNMHTDDQVTTVKSKDAKSWCLSGACTKLGIPEFYNTLNTQATRLGHPNSIVGFNDNPRTGWPQVKRFLEDLAAKGSIAAIFLLVMLAPTAGHADTPGRHTVLLTWTPGTCGGAAGTCTTKVYRGTTANVCGANNNNPIPYATGIVGSTYTDVNPPNGAVFYNVSNVDPSRGGESTCNGEVQVTVQPITTSPDTSLAGAVQ